MDSAEEELRQKLLVLERSVFDPALNGRGEEIWARMVSVRERGRQLQLEFERAGRNMIQDQGQGIDEEVMKRAKKVHSSFSVLLQMAKMTHRGTDSRRLQFPAIAPDEGASTDPK